MHPQAEANGFEGSPVGCWSSGVETARLHGDLAEEKEA